MRTAESVLLMCCPPAPPARKVSTLMSFSLMLELHVLDFRVHVHGREGRMPARVGVERRNAHQAVHADLRTQVTEGEFAGTSMVALLMPASSPGCSSRISNLKPFFCSQLMYMRSSMRAQSWDSVPPAPEWMLRMAGFSSFSPLSIFLSSSSRTLASRGLAEAMASLRVVSSLSSLAISANISSSLTWWSKDFHSSTHHWRVFICFWIFWALAVSDQNPGSEAVRSKRAISSCLRARSKIPP